MGYIKDILNQPNLQTFPNATFEISNAVPVAQCREALLSIFGATVIAGQNTITLIGTFTAYYLVGKVAEVTAPAPLQGTYTILSHTDDVLTTDFTFPNPGVITAGRVQDPAGPFLTRNAKSFGAFIRDAGFSTTFKNGLLYTDMPSAQLQNACSTTFAPLT